MKLELKYLFQGVVSVPAITRIDNRPGWLRLTPPASRRMPRNKHARTLATAAKLA